MLTHGSLFAGIGGFDLGFERAGIQTIWQVENDPYAIKVLEKHWPEVTRYKDIKKIEWEDVAVPDIVSGGFPCQPVSVAGKRKGTEDERWLWPEFARCLRILRPRFAVLENVPGLLRVGLGGEPLSELGNDCGAADVADAPSDLRRTSRNARSTAFNGGGATVGDTRRSGQRGVNGGRSRAESSDRRADVADAEGKPGEIRETPAERQGGLASGGTLADTASEGRGQSRAASEKIFQPGTLERFTGRDSGCREWWATEPDVGRVAHGIPARVDRLKCLGNSIVPQIAEWLANRIKAVAK